MWPITIGAALIGILLVTGSPSATASPVDVVLPSRRRKNSNLPVLDFPVRIVEKKVKKKSKETGEEKIVSIYRQEIAADPQVLARQASEILGREVPLDTFALATLASSEAGTAPRSQRILAEAAVIHAAITYARREKKTIMELLAPNGRFGEQHGRYASTVQPPTFLSIEIAEAVTKGNLKNPTPGAIKWDSPSGMNAAAKKKIPGYKMPENGLSPADQLAETRRNIDRLVDIYPRGVDPGYLRMWRPV